MCVQDFWYQATTYMFLQVFVTRSLETFYRTARDQILNIHFFTTIQPCLHLISPTCLIGELLLLAHIQEVNYQQ